MKAVLLLLLLLPLANAATIYGAVYDFGLNKVEAVVDIDTTPRQQMVAKNGSYSFAVNAGSYILRARHVKTDSIIEENITVNEDGSYVLDLILLPSFDALDDVDAVPDDMLIDDVVQDRPVSHWLAWLVVFTALGFLVYRSVKSAPEKLIQKEVREVPVADELNSVMKFIDEQGGRATQKDIRKQFPYSEAKVSLMIDELEEKGLVKRIKKGRGNVIVKA